MSGPCCSGRLSLGVGCCRFTSDGISIAHHTVRYVAESAPHCPQDLVSDPSASSIHTGTGRVIIAGDAARITGPMGAMIETAENSMRVVPL